SRSARLRHRRSEAPSSPRSRGDADARKHRARLPLELWRRLLGSRRGEGHDRGGLADPRRPRRLAGRAHRAPGPLFRRDEFAGPRGRGGLLGPRRPGCPRALRGPPPCRGKALATLTRPLAGRSVLVTRPRAQAEGLAARIAELGATVWRLPGIAI